MARNAGLEKAKGEKIFFWDSDDTMESTTIAECIEFSQKHNVNAVLYGYANRENGIKRIPHPHELKDEYRGKEIVEELIPHFLGHSYSDINNWISGKRGLRQGKEHTALWRIMLDSETIKNNHLKFDTRLSLGEDTFFINEYMLYEKSIGFLDKCLYYLTMRSNGANLSSLNNAEKRLQDKLKLIECRKILDVKAKELSNTNIHSYWEGTMVLSAMELAVRLSINKNKSYMQNEKMYNQFCQNKDIRTAIKNFAPILGLKAIPFLVMKYCGCDMFFSLISILPNKLINALIKV